MPPRGDSVVSAEGIKGSRMREEEERMVSWEEYGSSGPL